MCSAPHGSGTVPESAAAACLVTGATGFIGSALVRRLRAEGVFVRGIARSRGASVASDLVVADLTFGPLPPTLLNGIDTVYHLAAKTHDLVETDQATAEYWSVNLEGTQRLVEAVRRGAIRRVVFASSVKAIGEDAPPMVDESYPPQPTTTYGRSKLATERLLLSEGARHGFETVCLRFPLVYGPGQRGNLARMVAAIDRGRFLPPPANGNCRSMLHVENAVDALLLAGRHPNAAGQTYFVTDQEAYSTRDLYNWIRNALGKRPVRWAVPEVMFRVLAGVGDLSRRSLGRRIGFDSEAFQKLLGSAVYDSGRIRKELGYRAERHMLTALPELVAEHRARVSGGSS
jgi:UDP-glucose 4-epimerase